MKNFIFPLLCACLIISCSTEDVNTDTDVSNKEIRLKSNVPNFTNPANKYDYVGQLNVEILENFEENYQPGAVLSEVIANVDDIAATNTDFTALATSYPGLETTTMQWTLDNIDSPEVVIDATSLSPQAKTLLAELVGMIDVFENHTDAVNYADIKSFETRVLSDNALSVADLKVILCTASITRYSINYDKDKLRKWDKVRSGVVASINGDVAMAVTSSATASIMVQ